MKLNKRRSWVLSVCAGLTAVAASGTGAQNARWSEMPALPVPLSGHFAGESHGALLVVGGSNFPVPLYEGGAKKWLAEIWVLPPGATTWTNAGALPQALAYGASIADGKGLICIGGGNAGTHTNAVFRLEWKSGRLNRTELPPLPKPCANLNAARLGDTIYVAGGQETPTATSALDIFWALDFKDEAARWRELAPCPGGPRILPVMAAQDGAIYLASGASLHADAEGKAERTSLQDAWCFRPKTGWQRIAAPPAVCIAAPAAPVGKSLILVFGGSDGSIGPREAAQLKDKHPGFSRDVLSYDTRRDLWTKVETLPVGLVTTNAVKLGRQIVIPGGEDRPGHRNPRVLCYFPASP